MRAAARWRSLSKQLRSLPEVFDARHRISREVMRAYEQRIIMHNLRPRRLVICVIETNQRIPKKWAELTAGFGRLLARIRLDGSSQIRSHLQFGMTVVVNSSRPLRSLTAAENRTRHFELPQLARQRDQIFALLCSVRHRVQTRSKI